MFEFLRKLLGVKKKERKTPYVRQTPRTDPNYVSRNKFERTSPLKGSGLRPGELLDDDDFISPAVAVQSLMESNARAVSMSAVEHEAPVSRHTPNHSHHESHGHYSRDSHTSCHSDNHDHSCSDSSTHSSFD